METVRLEEAVLKKQSGSRQNTGSVQEVFRFLHSAFRGGSNSLCWLQSLIEILFTKAGLQASFSANTLR